MTPSQQEVLKSVTTLIRTIEVEPIGTAESLDVFGLRWNNQCGPEYTTLDEALLTFSVEVTEVSQAGSVPDLRLVNHSDEPVFLMAGEQLIGAKQNRVINADIMVPACTELLINVSCVEAGRWKYFSSKLAASGNMSHGRLRRLMTKHSLDAYRKEGKPLSRQGEVWNEVARKLEKLGSESPSRELEQTYRDHEERLGNLLATLKAPQHCHGAAFALGGRVVGADLFDRPATLARFWPKIVRGYALDALEEDPGAATKAAAVHKWLQSAAVVKKEMFKSPGLGDDVRLEGKDLIGAGLMVEGRPVHLELFVSA